MSNLLIKHISLTKFLSEAPHRVWIMMNLHTNE